MLALGLCLRGCILFVILLLDDFIERLDVVLELLDALEEPGQIPVAIHQELEQTVQLFADLAHLGNGLLPFLLAEEYFDRLHLAVDPALTEEAESELDAL